MPSSRPMSKMLVWRKSRTHYMQSGHELWNRGAVPFVVSTNPALAETYAHIIRAWLRDAETKTPPRVAVIELGCATGRFGYYLLRALDGLDVTYAMTDISEENLRLVSQQRRLRTDIKAGRVVVKRLALGDKLPVLRGATHAVIVANYVLDSVPADMFSARTGQLCEWRERRGRLEPEAVTERRYTDPLLEKTLHQFARAKYPLFGVSEDVATLLRRMKETKRPTLMIASDKAFVRKDQATRELTPFIQEHSGTSSITVDFEVTAALARAHGMTALLPTDVASFSTAVFSHGVKRVIATEASYDQALAGGSIIEGLRVWTRASMHPRLLDMADMLALLRQSHGDTEIFSRIAQALHALVSAEKFGQHRQPLLEALRLVSRHLYFAGETGNDPSFALGELFLTLESFEDAERCFRDSLLNGTRRKKSLEGLLACYLALGRDEEARDAAMSLNRTATG